MQTIVHLRLEAHWNSFFAHFISFAKVHPILQKNLTFQEFDLLEPAEIEPLKELVETMESQGQIA